MSHLISPNKLTREARRVAQQVNRLFRSPNAEPTPARPHLPSPDFTQIRDRYARSELGQLPDTFALWRIIGNDLVPRHRKGQSRDNLAFLLEHEPKLAQCTKHWLLNRICDSAEEASIIELLQQYEQTFHRIPFDIHEYAKQPWDVEGIPEALHSNLCDAYGPDRRVKLETRIRRHKNNYAMNNNGARNAALSLGRGLAKWVLPWDGNCFVTEGAWASILETVARQPFLPYFVVPMVRVSDNGCLFDKDYMPCATEEPQIIFRCDAQEMFDESHPYGRRPKVELLWRLGVAGKWDNYPVEPFDLPRPGLAREAYQYAQAGWVARLSSGTALEVGPKNAKRRSRARDEAIIRFLDQLDQEAGIHQGGLHGA